MFEFIKKCFFTAIAFFSYNVLKKKRVKLYDTSIF